MNILCIGDVVGTPGYEMVSAQLKYIKQDYNIDFVVANGENSAPGNGINHTSAQALFNSGVDVITLGNHGLEKSEARELLKSGKPIIRPANLPESTPGIGYIIKEVLGKRVAVINLLGRVFLPPVNSPFEKAVEILDEISAKADIILVDFHAEATSEKAALGWYLDGKVCAVFGTHTHVQTADERLLPAGTAFISDIGMTGPYNSVLGMDKDVALTRFLSLMNRKYEIAPGNCILSGIIIKTEGNRATSIERLSIK